MFDSFILMVESFGLICCIDEWVLCVVCVWIC